jgi:hypothetical protein
VTGKEGKNPRKRPRGRPPRREGERLSKNRTFRVRGGLDEKLQAAAAASGRSVSEEIEFRLDQSFDRDAFIGLVVGGDKNANVLRTIATAMKYASHSGHWLNRRSTVEIVGDAASYIIKALVLPKSSFPIPEKLAHEALLMAENIKATTNVPTSRPGL